ncbi:hypothetical protein GGR53DRAFT_911 [Hypoxylon sp. FL1150]|nr:hypothetical protein GGR53DRAFT_911 [Hypoxylon sp. FL1150]
MPPPEQLLPDSTSPLVRPEVAVTPDHDPAMSDQKSVDPPHISTTTSATLSKPGQPKTRSIVENGVKESIPGTSALDGRTTQGQAQADLTDLGEDKTSADPISKPGHEAVSNSNAPTDPMESSIATLKPSKPQYLSITTAPYVDPTPPTPDGSQPPSRAHSTHRSKGHGPEPSPTRSDAAYDERRYASEDEQEGTSRSEIQSIMEQFPEDGGGPGEDEVMSPRLEFTSPLLGGPPMQHPPRKSSLEPLAPSIAQQLQDMQGLSISDASSTSMRSKDKLKELDDYGPPVPPKDGPLDEKPTTDPQASTASLHRPPPPEPEPEPALPFDFHRFLEQLKHKKADPVARYLKSFLSEFAKRQWMVHEQVKIISDFLAFISNKMAQCEVWSDVSDAEFDNAREGMEKLVMNRLYTQTFSPAIPPPQPIPGAKPKRRGGDRPMGPGRRGQHQEDVERDEILAQKINIYGWVKEEHLDIPPIASESGKKFLELAEQELLKIRTYRAPRDKIICVLNCCKVIFGLLKHNKSDSSADSFMPLLIYVVLRSNPDHLVSNVQYILRFRNQEKLSGEAGYYLSSLLGAIQFIENMDRTTLTISDEEFDKNVEAAVSAIAEKHRAEEPPAPPQPPQQSEKSGLYPPGPSSTRPSLDMDGSSTPRRSTSSNDGNDSAEEGPAISGLLRSIQKPLSSIGRIFSDEPNGAGPSSSTQLPQSDSTPARLSPRPSSDRRRSAEVRQRLSAEEAAARQASAEVAEAQRIHRAEHNDVVETLASMFPDLDREIISDVVYQKEGRVGLAVDACLALSS